MKKVPQHPRDSLKRNIKELNKVAKEILITNISLPRKKKKKAAASTLKKKIKRTKNRYSKLGGSSFRLSI